MHPVLRRYLNVTEAWATVQKPVAERTSEERCFVTAWEKHAREREALRPYEGKRRLSEEAQSALLALATFGAVAALEEEPVLGEALREARAALLSAGASSEQSEAYLAALVAEEGFGFDDDPLQFHADFLLETLKGIPALTALTPDALKELQRTWLEDSPGPAPLKRRVTDALLGAAWEDGPEPINAEHVRAARSQLPSPADREALAGFLEFLAQRRLVGPERLGRLVTELR